MAETEQGRELMLRLKAGDENAFPELVARYNSEINDILKQPAVRDALAKQGLQARGGTAARLAEMMASDQPRWAKVVKDAGIAPE